MASSKVAATRGFAIGVSGDKGTMMFFKPMASFLTQAERVITYRHSIEYHG